MAKWVFCKHIRFHMCKLSLPGCFNREFLMWLIRAYICEYAYMYIHIHIHINICVYIIDRYDIYLLLVVSLESSNIPSPSIFICFLTRKLRTLVVQKAHHSNHTVLLTSSTFSYYNFELYTKTLLRS